MPFQTNLDSYYNHLLKPAIENLNYNVVRADEIYGNQPIIEDITREIKEAYILVADVTGKNPNVNYELGYAHALKKEVIIISQSIDDVPFDYRHRRVIIYDTTQYNWQEKLKDDIERTVRQVEVKIQEKHTLLRERKNQKNQPVVINGDLPSKATLKYKGMFVRLSARAGQIQNYMIDMAVQVIEDICKVQIDESNILTLRGVWYDDKYGNANYFIDYLYDEYTKPIFNEDTIKEMFHDGYVYYGEQGTFIEPKCIKEKFSSDGFFVNSDCYYNRVY